MASDFPPGFLLVGLIAASSALIFWLLPPNAGAEMANRVPADRRPVGSADGMTDAAASTNTGLARDRDSKIRKCCLI